MAAQEPCAGGLVSLTGGLGVSENAAPHSLEGL